MKLFSVKNKVILLIGILSFINGCAGNQYQRYSGVHLAESIRATLKPWKNEIQSGVSGSRIVLPVSIDGKEVEIPSRNEVSATTYFISSGEREIKVVLFANIAGKKKQIINPDSMMFQAIKGHVYITKASIKTIMESNVDIKLKLSFWIEDETTGEVVSGTRLTEQSLEDY